ncbi:MAG: serine hydroxymethyltransferase [Acidiferrobacterales bacterium]
MIKESHRTWTDLFAAPLKKADQTIASLVTEERLRNEVTVNLIASESYCPRATLDAEATILVNKNATGYPGRRNVAGCEIVDQIERLAQDRANRLFGAEHANVQALASTIGNIAVLRALLRPGDRILALGEEAGGHHSHGASCHLSGQDYEVAFFGPDESREDIDLAEVEHRAASFHPRLIIAGSTAYPRALDFRGLHAIAQRVGAYLFADIAHVAGLVAAGLHDNPAPYADVVTTSTHKTLCGPRTGGLILSKKRYAEAIDGALFPGLQGAPGVHIIAARAVLFELVAGEAFRKLMEAVVRNAQALARSLLDHGVPLYLGGTDTHMVVVDLRARELDPIRIERRLSRHGVLSNRVCLKRRDGDRSTVGLRLGTTAMTIRGMREAEFVRLGELISSLLDDGESETIDARVAHEVADMAAQFPLPPGPGCPKGGHSNGTPQ